MTCTGCMFLGIFVGWQINIFWSVLGAILGLGVFGPMLGVRVVERGCSCKAGNALHAVKGCTFSVSTGEVFGLLGTNGAGKTTLFSMLSGSVAPSYGAVSINGKSILERVGLQLARNVIGFCPQTNPIIGILTVREHLELYARIKGMTGPAMKEAVESWVLRMDLADHAHKLAGTLSGGNKRKLCMSMARKQAAVILTTHSMEECEALCNRAVIMVNGQFRTIGTHVEIKRTYGQGRELVVKLVPPTKEEINTTMGSLRGAGDEIKQLNVENVLPTSETEWVKTAAKSTMAPFRVQLS